MRSNPESMVIGNRAGKLGNQVAELLRRQILEGMLKPGDRLAPEDELIKTFGISRPTLREGLRILESLQFIQIYRGKKGGAEITLPTKATTVLSAANYLQSQKATLEDLIAARVALEPVLLLSLDKQISQKTIDSLRKIIANCEDSDRSPKSVTQMLSLFRRTLFNSIKNPVLNLVASVIIEVHEAIILQIVLAHTARTPAFAKHSIGYLKRQLGLLAQNDVKRASLLNRQYLRRLMRMLRESNALETRITALGESTLPRGGKLLKR